MSDDLESDQGNILGAIFAILSGLLSLAFIIALFNFRTAYPGVVLLALVVSASLAFWFLDGPATWRKVKDDHADELAAKANEQEALAAIVLEREARREAVTVWSMPDRSLFDAPKDRSLDWDYNDPDPDTDLRRTLNAAEVDDLFAHFRDDPRLNWMIGLTHCEARADLMAEIAAERGVRLDKLWVMASDLDRGTVVSGIEGKIRVDVNYAGTETVEWNYHVAPCGVVEDDSMDKSTTVFDPLLFDAPVSNHAWCERMQRRGDDVNFNTTDRFVSTNPFDVNGRQFRTLKVKERNARLLASFDLENDQTVAALATTLCGRFVDTLLANSASDFNEFIRCLKQPGFPCWWQSSSSYARMQALLVADGYYDISMSDIESTISAVSPELREHAIKTRYWKTIAPALLQLDDAYLEIRRSDSPDVDIERWRQPDAHGLWAEHGFEFSRER